MAIGGFASQVSRNLSEDADSNKKLQVVIQETKRVEAMVKEMLEFGKPIELVLSSTDLNELAEKTVEALEPAASKEGVDINIEPDRSMPDLDLDGAKLKQVLTNLITNAVQACAAGEEVLVKPRRSDAEALVEITDQGCGISEEDREKIFQPFFSTKKQGTGLGWPTSKGSWKLKGEKWPFMPTKTRGRLL